MKVLIWVGCEDERECEVMRYNCWIGVWLRRRWQEWKHRMGWRFSATAETTMAGGLAWEYGRSGGVGWDGDGAGWGGGFGVGVGGGGGGGDRIRI